MGFDSHLTDRKRDHKRWVFNSRTQVVRAAICGSLLWASPFTTAIILLKWEHHTWYWYYYSRLTEKVAASQRICLLIDIYYQDRTQCPGWCVSVHWVPACEPKGWWFDSHSGHVPGLWSRSPVGGMWETTTHWCFSLSFSLPSPLSKNKINKIF